MDLAMDMMILAAAQWSLGKIRVLPLLACAAVLRVCTLLALALGREFAVWMHAPLLVHKRQRIHIVAGIQRNQIRRGSFARIGQVENAGIKRAGLVAVVFVKHKRARIHLRKREPDGLGHLAAGRNLLADADALCGGG